MDNFLNANQGRFDALAQDFTAYDPNVTAIKVKNATLDLSLAIDQNPLILQNLAADLDNNYSACYNTAASIFGIVGDGEQVGPGSAQEFDSASAFRTVVSGLCDVLRTAVSNQDEKLFRIEYAGHGFILATRPDGAGMVVEHFESLAHTASLIESLNYNPYGVEHVCAALMQMCNDAVSVRRHGAEFFGWNADMINVGPAQTNNRGEFYRHQLKWWSRDLRHNWANLWQAAVTARYNQLCDITATDHW